MAYSIGEIVLIVVGILIAVEIGDRNQARKDRAEETEILQGLQGEFIGYQKGMVKNLKMHGDILSALANILKSMEAGSWVSEEQTIDEALDYLFSPPTSELGNGIRDALVQGGRMEFISNRILRARLATWPRTFEELRDDQLISRKLVLDELVPYFVSKETDLSSAFRSWGEEWPVNLTPIASDSEAMGRLLADPELKTLIQVRYGFWGHATREYERVIIAVEEILDLIDAELAERGM